MRALRAFSVASAIGAWAVIVIGGYVTATESGLGCRNVIDCGPTPFGSAPATVELAHRLAAWAEGFLVLALLVLVIWRYRAWHSVRNLTALAFVLIAAQSTLGMLSVYAGYEAYAWYPILVTAHLGVATAFLAVSVLNAAAILRGSPPSTAPVTLPASAGTVDSS